MKAQNKNNHINVFINNYKQEHPHAPELVHILLKDKHNNIIREIIENAAIEDKNIQDYSSLLTAFKKASEIGANKITLFLDNLNIYRHFNEGNICDNKILKDFFHEARQLSNTFEEVNFMAPQESTCLLN